MTEPRRPTDRPWSRGGGTAPHPGRESVRRWVLHAEDDQATPERLNDALDVIAASMDSDRRIERLLAAALGYRKYGEVDDNPPGDRDDYVIGDHTAETLAAEAARRLTPHHPWADQNEWHPFGECHDREACPFHAGRNEDDHEPLEAVVLNDISHVLLGLYGFLPLSVRMEIGREVFRMVAEYRASRPPASSGTATEPGGSPNTDLTPEGVQRRAQARQSRRQSLAGIRDLVERSSFGTPGAKALRKRATGQPLTADEERAADEELVSLESDLAAEVSPGSAGTADQPEQS